MSVAVLNQTVRDIGHVVDICSELNEDFNDFLLFNLFNQLVVGISFSLF